MRKAICVFSSSSDEIDPLFFKTAEELGDLIAQYGYTLIYGGGNAGLMGALARSAHSKGGKIIGVIPEAVHNKVAQLKLTHELIVTKDMRDRKTVMEQRSDAFIGLPGGFGTLEEIMEMMTLKQLRYHSKPIVLVNTNGFYDKLTHFFEHLYDGNFAKSSHRKLYHIVPDIKSIFSIEGENSLPRNIS